MPPRFLSRTAATVACILLAATAPAGAKPPAGTTTSGGDAADPNSENLTVHGQRKYVPVPRADDRVIDRFEQRHDPNTGAAIGQFGGAYSDSAPMTGPNVGEPGVQSPIQAGVNR